MNYLDLFSGCGGFRRGLEEAGFTFEWEGHSEIDKYAKQVYEKHYPESEDLGDVRTVRIDRLPKINLITFGFPCQDLSIAGKRGGLEASRSGLFFEAMRIVRDAKPDYFIFENVKGLFSSRGGLDWLNVLREVADSGYDGQWQLLNTRWFLPQNRERIYFVGHPRGTSRPQIFPIGEDGEITRKIVGSPGWTESTTAISTTLHNPGKSRIEDTYIAINKKRQLRRLTPTECERLQGFPDGWTEGQSDTQRYKMMGNAVSVLVIKAVVENLPSPTLPQRS